MDKIVIVGGKALKGEVEVSGSKNSALPCLFATLLTDDTCILENVPDLVDIQTTCSLLTHLGKKVERKNHTVTIRSNEFLKTEAPYDLVRKMRASALVLGPLLARRGKAAASLPGGCAIGVRPINIHLSGFESLGAQCKLTSGIVHLEARKLKGKKIRFAFPSVGATENLLMAAVLAQGETVIQNAAREPEIVDLANFLNEMGAEVRGAGSPVIRISGKKYLSGAKHRVIPDRIEAATYLIAAAATRGAVTVKGASYPDIKVVLDKIRKTGVQVTVTNESGRGTQAIRCAWRKELKPISVQTRPHPDFPTDVQAQWMALMATVKGKSRIQEAVFENRFLHVGELSRMGADIQIRGREAIVTGVPRLSGANVMVSDLRAGAAMVIAGLVAQGKTVVHRIYHLDRGYEKLESKLKKLGARIQRIH